MRIGGSTKMRFDYELNLVPHKYDEYLIDMNYRAYNEANVFRERKRVTNRIFTSLMKTSRNNVILLGENGVGKSSVIKFAVYHVLDNKCPKELSNCHFMLFNIEKIIADLGYNKSRCLRKLQKLFEFILESDNFVVVIDQIYLMFDFPILIYYLSVLLNSDVKLIGISTQDEFNASFELEPKLCSMFDIIQISEPSSKKIYSMICDNVDYIAKKHGVTVSEDLVIYTSYVSKAFASPLADPGRVIDTLEKSMVVAKRRGHKEVTRKDINYNFNFNYELYNNMSEESKRITAYHEAGHYIVSKMSGNIQNYKTIAITIVPSENFLGVTIFESEMEKQTSLDLDYYIDQIATDLGGRVAEIILQGNADDSKLTSGAYSDLKNATQTAREVITEFGMIDDFGENRTFLCNYDALDLALLSEDNKVSIDEHTKNLIDEAFDRAKEILNTNRKLLDLIAQELLINEVLDEKDLERLCSQVNDNE